MSAQKDALVMIAEVGVKLFSLIWHAHHSWYTN